MSGELFVAGLDYSENAANWKRRPLRFEILHIVLTEYAKLNRAPVIYIRAGVLAGLTFGLTSKTLCLLLRARL